MDDLAAILGRREARRISAMVGAELLTPSRRQLVVVEDISVSGAKLQLRKSIGISTACLLREGHGIWGEIVWCDDKNAGMRFYEKWSPDDLFAYANLDRERSSTDARDQIHKFFDIPSAFSGKGAPIYR